MAMLSTFAAKPVPELKQAILMTYYGTLDDSARVVSFDALTRRVREAFPDREVREAYTSRSTANAMRRRLGKPHLLLPAAMAQLEQDGYNSVIVVTTEMMEGKTLRLMEQRLDTMRSQFFEVKLTTPLLYTADDCRAVMERVIGAVGVQADEQAVFVAHGKNGAADDVFCLADYILQHEGHANCHIGTVEGYPSLEMIKQILRQQGTSKVVLAPLMVTCGGHSKRFVAGAWRQALEAEGYDVRVSLSGVLDYPEIQQLIIDKIRQTDLRP